MIAMRPMSFIVIRSRGVGMLEILIAAAIIAVAFIPILSAIQFGNRSTVKINNYSKAAKLAQSLIEECKHTPIKKYAEKYKSTPDKTLTDIAEEYYPVSAKEFKEFGKSLKDFKYKAQLKPLRHPDDKDKLREVWIQVEVNWREGDGTTVNQPRTLRIGNALHNPDSD
ncbi:MAG TPA: hypothetical protein PKO06_09440 [Candidatus Ozemobacteraceae bacterium]|nr:hypothetical protein [Candidatus Ozemobacteraceae bacterium]